jgi:hypothetical protein
MRAQLHDTDSGLNVIRPRSLVANVKDDAEIQLSQHAGDGVFGCAINVRLTGVDSLFRKYLESGLDITGREDSPVHRGPVDQTSGIREFYVTDSDGNTLRFGEPIP